MRDLLVSAAGAKHLDETGFRIGGRTQWLHVLSTPWLTFYRTSAQRGSLLDGLRGILVHDHWASYFKVEGVLHGLCNAHHLRELEALAKIDGEAWARRMQQLLRRANWAVGIVRERGQALPRSLLERIERRYEQLVRQALAQHEALPALPSGRRGRQEAPPGAQSGVAAEGPAGVGAAFSERCQGALHEQSSRAGSAHDETEDEDLRWVPVRAGGPRFRHAAQRAVDRAEAGPEPHRGLAARTHRAVGESRIPAIPLIRACCACGVPGQLRSVYGATDEFGYHAVEDRMKIQDLHATVLHLMGLDHERLTYRHAGRDFRLTDVAGTVATKILA